MAVGGDDHDARLDADIRHEQPVIDEQVHQHEVRQIVHDKHLVLAAGRRPGAGKGGGRIEDDHIEAKPVRGGRAAEFVQRLHPAQVAIPHLDLRGSALTDRSLTCLGNLRAARHGHAAAAPGHVDGQRISETGICAGYQDPLAVEAIGIRQSGCQRLFPEAVLETRQRGDHRIVKAAVRHRRFAYSIVGPSSSRARVVCKNKSASRLPTRQYSARPLTAPNARRKGMV